MQAETPVLDDLCVITETSPYLFGNFRNMTIIFNCSYGQNKTPLVWMLALDPGGSEYPV